MFVNGSPERIDARATVPFTIWSEFGLASCVRKVESTDDFGQFCQRTISGITGLPGSMLLEATSTPTVETAADCAFVGSVPPPRKPRARKAATPDINAATLRTIKRDRFMGYSSFVSRSEH